MVTEDCIKDRLGQEIFTRTLNKLIARSKMSYREIASELNIPTTSFYELTTGSRSYRYSRLKQIANFFRKKLNDESITLEYLLLGDSETYKVMQERIDEIKAKLEKELWETNWKLQEAKQQLSLFKE